MNIQTNNDIIKRVYSSLHKYRQNNDSNPDRIINSKPKHQYDIISTRDNQLKALEQYADRINSLFGKTTENKRNYSAQNRSVDDQVNAKKLNSSAFLKQNTNQSQLQSHPQPQYKQQDQPQTQKQKKKNMIPSNKFTVTSYLGKGRFADVFKAKDHINKKSVALKIMQKSIIKRHQIEHLVRQEILILKKIQHPNIIQLFQVTEDNQKITIALEECECNLTKAKQQYNFSQEQCLKYLFQIAKGLQYLHGNSIIHRDLKLENILYTNDTVKIGDFGLAREVPGICYGKIQLQELCGTDGYMAPEVKKYKPYGLKADIYSFGVLSYELFAGQLPVIKNMRLESTVGIPFPLDNLIEQCIQENDLLRPTITSVIRHKVFDKIRLEF